MLTRPQAPPRREEWGFLCFFFFNPNALKNRKYRQGHTGEHTQSALVSVLTGDDVLVDDHFVGLWSGVAGGAGSDCSPAETLS